MFPRIMILDNNTERRKVISVALREKGCKVIEVAEVKIAWEKVINVHQRPQLLIVCLENKQNAEILKVLPKATTSLPVIILYRQKFQIRNIFILETWKEIMIPFNPMKLTEEVLEMISSAPH